MFPETRLDPSIPIGFTPRAKRFGVGPAMSVFRKPTVRHGTDRLRTALSRAGAEPGPERLLRPRLACRHFPHRTVRRSGWIQGHRTDGRRCPAGNDQRPRRLADRRPGPHASCMLVTTPFVRLLA